MSFIASAIIGSSLIGGIGSIIAGGEQASGQEQAANTQAGMFNTIVGQENPFLQGGYGAETALGQLLGTSKGSFGGLPNGYLTQTFQPTMSQLEQYPGYQFALTQGDQALNNQNSPGVGAVSGPALKSLMNYNQGLASTQYQNAFNNFNTQQNNIFNRLSGIASLGQNAAGNLGNAGTQLGTGIAQAQAAATGSIAGGIVGATNSASNGLALNYLLNGNNGYGITGGGGTVSNPGYSNEGGGYQRTYCDYYLKQQLERVKRDTQSRLHVYDFWYVNQDTSEPKWRGYIAQEVREVYPQAVGVGPKGYLTVDYSKIPSEMPYPLRVLNDKDWLELQSDG